VRITRGSLTKPRTILTAITTLPSASWRRAASRKAGAIQPVQVRPM
jgi:hypothetical protein